MQRESRASVFTAALMTCSHQSFRNSSVFHWSRGPRPRGQRSHYNDSYIDFTVSSCSSCLTTTESKKKEKERRLTALTPHSGSSLVLNLHLLSQIWLIPACDWAFGWPLCQLYSEPWLLAQTEQLEGGWHDRAGHPCCHVKPEFLRCLLRELVHRDTQCISKALLMGKGVPSERKREHRAVCEGRLTSWRQWDVQDVVQPFRLASLLARGC